MSPIEAKVAAVFAQHFKSTELTPDDDIFELGGDSMEAVSIALQLEDEFGIELPLEALEQSASIRAVAAIIEQQLAMAGSADSVGA